MSDPDEVFDAYRRRPGPVPEINLGWNMYGVGVESMGADGRPEHIPARNCEDDELLIRVDTVGLCYSDVKLIHQGGNHPKLYGRDLRTEPTRLGHEAAVTVVSVGKNLADRYRPGQRLAIQPDIHVDGKSTAYGYTIPGGLIQYHVIGPEVLDGDDGAYVIEVDDSVTYVAAALSEPWACVEAAYTQRRRLEPRPGGTMWIVGHAQLERSYSFSRWLDRPATIVLSDAPPQIHALVENRRHHDAEVLVRDGVQPKDYSTLSRELTSDAGFDDIVVLEPHSASQVGEIARHIGFRGTLNLVGNQPLDGPSPIDVGRIHYHYTAYLGTSGTDIADAYGIERNRAELRPGGVAVFVGGAGPMGQMHIQRAIELENGPAVLVASDVDENRLDVVRQRLVPLARERGRQLVVLDVSVDPDLLRRTVDELTAGRGADDVIVSVPVASIMERAAQIMAPDGMLVLFAGVPNGSFAQLDMSSVFLHNAQYTGTSGSSVSDQAVVLDKAIRGALSPERSLAAVGGIEAARDGVQAMLDGTFAGKIVIFPQLRGLPLLDLAELAIRYPDIGAALDERAWTAEAEKRLIATFWHADQA